MQESGPLVWRGKSRPKIYLGRSNPPSLYACLILLERWWSRRWHSRRFVVCGGCRASHLHKPHQWGLRIGGVSGLLDSHSQVQHKEAIEESEKSPAERCTYLYLMLLRPGDGTSGLCFSYNISVAVRLQVYLPMTTPSLICLNFAAGRQELEVWCHWCWELRSLWGRCHLCFVLYHHVIVSLLVGWTCRFPSSRTPLPCPSPA